MSAGRAPRFLAVDVGTTSVKVVLFDAEGTPCFEDRAVIRLHHPRPSWAEIDARDWWDAAAALLRRAAATAPPEEIAAIGVTGLMHALVPVDDDGEPLDRTILWFDQRSHRQSARLAARWDEELRLALGRPPGMGSAPPKLLWLREERPGLIERTRVFLTAKDFVRLCLTGEPATDPTDAAGTGLTERGGEVWSGRLLEELLAVPLAKLPPIRRSAEIVGRVTGRAERATGLVAGTPVVAGMADMPATLLGVDAFVPDRAVIYLGTGIWMALSRSGGTEEQPSTHFLGATATCGSSLVWFQRAIGGAGDGELSVQEIYRAQEAAASVPPGAEGVLFLPHLMGERGFEADPHARGVFFGLTLAHRSPHLLRAILEGNAFQIRRGLEQAATRAELPPLPDTLLLAGGGARTALWRGVIADVLGRSVQTPRAGEATAMGAALLAAVGAGLFPHPRAAAAAWVRLDEPSPPDPDRVAVYNRAYRLFCQLESAVAPLYAPAAEGIEPPRDAEHVEEHRGEYPQMTQMGADKSRS
jgi:xylulokinase